jgi:molecular chaperone IbpA
MHNTVSISASNTITGMTSVGGLVSNLNAINYPTYSYTYGTTDVTKQFIGWDEQLKDLEKLGERVIKNTGNFPPYNVIKEDDDTFIIEFAVAGFSKDDITVKQEKNALIIEGEIEENEEKKYVHKGIATRSFSRAFALAEYVEVIDAGFKNGILSITLERILPEEEQPKTIKIK